MQFSIRQPPAVIFRRLLIVWAASVFMCLMFCTYLLFIMERGRAFIGASIVNDPEKLAAFEWAVQSERRITTTFMVALFLFWTAPFTLVLKFFSDMRETG